MTATCRRRGGTTIMTIVKRAGKGADTPAGKAALQKVIQVSGADSPSAKQAKGMLQQMWK